MDLTQSKLTKVEWKSIEIPVSPNEITILGVIIRGYTELNIRDNHNLSMISIMKINNTPSMAIHIYKKYFESDISEMVLKFNGDKNIVLSQEWKKISKFVLDISKPVGKIFQIKKIDMMRLINIDAGIDKQRDSVIEYKKIEFCRKILESISSKTRNYTLYLYTLIQMKKSTIGNINAHVTIFVDLIILFASLNTKTIIRDTIHCSQEIIEKNPHILKFADLTLYDHQKQLFQLFNSHVPTSKLVLYTAPTGTGKTLSPIGLSENYRVIFVCAARHVGLSLARSAISMNKRVAFAFGCDTASDIRLHYFSALDYTRNKRSGGIGKVDNSNGSKVEIMICDVKSYITAMFYMLAFNPEENIILYWDEPTITMDYKSHPLHTNIHDNWKNNKISNIVLSSATLPCEADLIDTISGFRGRFDNTEIHTISSYDCKKSISIIDTNSNCVLPHLLFSDYTELQDCLANCDKNNSLLRYFDLVEVVRFLEYAEDNGHVNESYIMTSYFPDVSSITMSSIKMYYKTIMQRLTIESFTEINKVLVSCRIPKFKTPIKKIRSMNSARTENVGTFSPLSRLASVDTLLSDKYVPPLHTHIPQSLVHSTIPPTGGCMVTTSDAHTLTDGPTIFIVEDVDKIGKFCIQQSNLPEYIFTQIMERIEENNKKQVQIDALAKTIEDKIGEDSTKDRKVDNDRFSPEIKRMMNAIEALRLEIKSVSLDASYIPNTSRHQQLWTGEISNTAFASAIDDATIREIMELAVENNFKLLLLMGIGVFSMDKDVRYIELMKRLAYDQKLYMVIATSDYIYGTNYNFCHGYLGKDLENMTQQKIIQSIGRIGRGNIQHEYSIRVRDNSIIRKLFLSPEVNTEAINMEKMFSFE